MNDSVLHNLFCALISADCVYNNYMMSVFFSHNAARKLYQQFQADLPE